MWIRKRGLMINWMKVGKSYKEKNLEIKKEDYLVISSLFIFICYYEFFFVLFPTYIANI